VRRHLVIRPVHIRLVAAGAIDSGSSVVRDDELCTSAKELECSDMATDPVRHFLARCGVCERVAAGTQHRHKQRGWLAIASLAVVNRYARASPIDERLFARTVLLPKDNVLLPSPDLVELTKPAVAVAGGMSLAILLPEQLQGEVLVGLKLLMDRRPIRHCPDRLRLPPGPGGKQLLLQLPVVNLDRQRPAQTRSLSAFQVSMDGRLCDVAAARDLLLGEPQTEAQPENFLDLTDGQPPGWQI
jgi:hypothetical protein